LAKGDIAPLNMSYAKEIVSISCRLSTMYERDRQTDKQTDLGTVTSIDEIAFSDVA